MSVPHPSSSAQRRGFRFLARGGKAASSSPERTGRKALAVRRLRVLAGFGAALLATLAPAATPPPFKVPPAWITPTAPFHIVGPIWYVGSQGLAAYLIRTPAGAVLIDGTMAENVPAILRNVAAVGVRPHDIKRLLVTHAHFDHVAGDAAMVRATGARVFAGTRDVAALESGIPPGEVDYRAVRFAPIAHVHGVRDRDVLRFGGLAIRAIATPGHTPGNTSWTMQVTDEGRPVQVVFAGSLTTGGNRLIGNRRYPGIIADYRRSFARLATLPADVVLPAHPEIADVMAHARDGRWRQPQLLHEIAGNAARDFNSELARQRQAAARHPLKSQ
jgi:metallo-beta-lactamase class B